MFSNPIASRRFTLLLASFLCVLILAAVPEAEAQFLVTIHCVGNGQYLEVNSSNNRFVASAVGVATADVYRQVSTGGSYMAFQSYATGKYLSVQADTSVQATATNVSDYEMFTMTLTGASYTLTAKRNNALLSRDAADNRIWANTFTVTDNTRFVFNQVVDMWMACTAFADNYPGKAKLKNADDVLLYYTAESYDASLRHYWYTIFADGTNPPIGQPCWDKEQLAWLGGWEALVAIETLPQFTGGAKWDAPIPRCYRYTNATTSQTTAPLLTTFYWQPNGGCTWTLDTSVGNQGTAQTWGQTSVPYMLDLSNPASSVNMGRRWVVDVHYGSAPECWTYDLGPAPAVFAPQFGLVKYTNGLTTRPDYANAMFNNIQNADAAHTYAPRCPDFYQ